MKKETKRMMNLVWEMHNILQMHALSQFDEFKKTELVGTLHNKMKQKLILSLAIFNKGSMTQFWVIQRIILSSERWTKPLSLLRNRHRGLEGYKLYSLNG